MTHHGLNDPERNPLFHHVADEGVAQVVEAQARESRFCSETAPSRIPGKLMLQRVVISVAFLWAMLDAREVLG